MREILFRGKRLCNNKWMFGSLLCYLDGDRYICCDNFNGGHNHYRVDSETVGQFTGLLDKNGKEIFEGDIMNNAGNVVEFCNGCFCINGDSDLALWTKTEIIGNIHDNPELLG